MYMRSIQEQFEKGAFLCLLIFFFNNGCVAIQEPTQAGSFADTHTHTHTHTHHTHTHTHTHKP
jgi:hypothetical protein